MRAGLGSLQAKHGIVIALALVASMGLGARFAFSVALGGGMQIINLWWLERSVRAWVARAQTGETRGVSRAAGLRLMLLLATVGVVLLWGPVEPVPFTIGLSTAVPTVIWHGLVTAGREA